MDVEVIKDKNEDSTEMDVCKFCSQIGVGSHVNIQNLKMEQLTSEIAYNKLGKRTCI